MSYLARLTLSFVLVIVTVSLANWYVDPYGMYWSDTWQGFNAKKPQSGKRVRVVKPYRVERVQPEILLVGNSRVEMGIDPLSPRFDGASVYSVAMPGVSVERQLTEASVQIANNPSLKQIYLSVDYLDFLYSEAELEVFNQKGWEPPLVRPESNIQQLSDVASMLFSLDTAINSIKTVFGQSIDANHITAEGFNQPDGYLAIMRSEGIRALFRQKIAGTRGANGQL